MNEKLIIKILFVSASVLLLTWIVWSLVSSCGSWSPFGGGLDKSSCNCMGKVVAYGGPSGPADDGGGTYYCLGFKIPENI